VDRTGSDGWFSKILRVRTGLDSILSGLGSDWKIFQSTHLCHFGLCHGVMPMNSKLDISHNLSSRDERTVKFFSPNRVLIRCNWTRSSPDPQNLWKSLVRSSPDPPIFKKLQSSFEPAKIGFSPDPVRSSPDPCLSLLVAYFSEPIASKSKLRFCHIKLYFRHLFSNNPVHQRFAGLLSSSPKVCRLVIQFTKGL